MGLNEYINEQRRSIYAGAKAKRKQTDIVRACIKAARLQPYACPVEIRIVWIEGKRKGKVRDIDNVRFGAKFVLDALQEEGIIPNDNPIWVRHIFDQFRYNEKNPRIQVAIDEYDPTGRHVFYAPVTGLKELR